MTLSAPHRISVRKFFLCGQDQECSEACQQLVTTIHKKTDSWMRHRTKIESVSHEETRNISLNPNAGRKIWSYSNLLQRCRTRNRMIIWCFVDWYYNCDSSRGKSDRAQDTLRKEKLSHTQKTEQCTVRLQDSSKLYASIQQNICEEVSSTILRWTACLIFVLS